MAVEFFVKFHSNTLMEFRREHQRLTASQVLQALADGQDISLLRCTVSGDLEVDRFFEKEEKFDTSNLQTSAQEQCRIITFPQKIIMNECTFEGNVFFAPEWDDEGLLRVVFKQDAVFNMSVFKEQTRFADSTFHGRAGFDGCKFYSVAAFTDCKFGAQAMFRTVEFHGYALFNRARFAQDARFINTLLSKGGNFKESLFMSAADFSGVYSTGKSLPTHYDITFARRCSGDGETFWRYVKQAATEAGYYKLAGDCFYEERKCNMRGRFYGKNFAKLDKKQKIAKLAKGIKLLPEFLLGDLLFGYGEKPVRVIYAALTVIITCGLLYFSVGDLECPHSPNGSTFFESMYFSVITFTTLGFGDVYPNATHTFTRAVAMFEAISGTFLISLFVVCLAKRFSRG
ncbi:Ion channel [Sedimentisphaera salicampi]|uniref:Ion channel n=1 Tax=Sedimentisphaera salicampi TaxID=1941349 RepID=A0A1W6LMM0_9BACT|nr:Ion channel [Sedimentisphaera salicampi]